MNIKNLLSVVVLSVMPLFANAQSYDQLWKQFEEAQGKDLPKTEIAVLGKIVDKARQENNYGQLLAAGLKRGSTQVEISPDSLKSEVGRLETAAEQAGTPALKAVYNAILGDIYKHNSGLGDNHERRGKEYSARAMADADALARVQAKDLEPIVGKITKDYGYDSKYFGDDLLHVVGGLTGDYSTMAKYYSEHGNREAACLSLLMEIVNSNADNTEKSLRLDSLTNVYGDLEVCGEAAVERYQLMPEGNNAERKAKYEYGEQAVSRWHSWHDINSISNGQKSLTLPSFNYREDEAFSIPDKERTVKFSARNIASVTLTATRLNINGDTDLRTDNDKDLKQLKSARIASTAVTTTKQISFSHSYENVSDSIVIPKLPVGMWLLEFKSQTSNLKSQTSNLNPQYSLYHVSNVALISEDLPGKTFRYVIVNATTGKPIAGAHVKVTQRRGYRQSPIVETLTTNGKGETTFKSANGRNVTAWAYTDTDKAAASNNEWAETYGKHQANGEFISVFTDRSIYRPGQTVHAAVILYGQDNDNLTRKAIENRKVTITLRDANSKEVEAKTVTTDSFGSASADFALPSAGLTGNFSLQANADKCNDWASIKVEEYKRPTFEVTFDDYAEAYKAGDTITVRGHAKTYAGVPVQNARVEYSVTRQTAWWCWWNQGNGSDFTFTGKAVTDADGNFTARVPLILPSDDMSAIAKGRRLYHYYNMCVSAKVTDTGGESHEGELRLPLGTNPTALTCDLPDKILKDSLRTITFRRINMAGKPISGQISYYINKVEKGTVEANQSFSAPRLASGAYQLVATCGNDTLRKDFVVFSVDDKSPVSETHDWFWQSTSKFPNDGKPVFVQFGNSDSEQHFFYTLISGNDKVLEQGSIDKTNAIITREFKYKQEYGDGLVLNVAWVRNGKTYIHTAKISRPERDNHLRLAWKTFRNKLVPGQKEEWTLSVSTPDGKPANAQLMATLYDKSLDQISKHQWTFNPQYPTMLPGHSWGGVRYGGIYGYATADTKYATTKQLSFRSIVSDYYEGLLYQHTPFFGHKMMKMSRSNNVMLAAAPMNAMSDEMAMTESYAGAADGSEAVAPNAAEQTSSSPPLEGQGEVASTLQLRENLNESAFFYPQLTTDADGNVSLKFTLPESVTTWRFMGLALDADINYGLLTDEVVAKKPVMVQPNMPRFIRPNDKAQITTRIFNTTDKPVHGTLRIEFLDPTTEAVVTTEKTIFDVDSSSTTSATFAFDINKALGNQKSPLGGDLVWTSSLFIVRIIAEGDGFSDGEQHYLAVLPDVEYVTNTYPFTQVGAGTKSVAIDDIVPKGVNNAKVTFEYTNNPEWLMIQALPYVSNPDSKNAISLVTAYFANSIAYHIMYSDPQIKRVFEQWKQALPRTGETEGVLMSNLEKDQELKSLVLSETPWVADAESEASQKRALANYFDENTISNQISTLKSQLSNLQNPDGSFSWWQGMDGSYYMTVAVVKTLVRLKASLNLPKGETSLVRNAWSYLDKETALQVKEMKRLQAKGIKVYPSDALCDYVYACALAKRNTTADINYIVDLLAKMPRDLTIYGKANSAVILAMYGKTKIANEYLQSINEYSVYKEEMGRYFDTQKAQYSWFDYKIPTQTAAIEAYLLLKPNDTTTVTELRRWLLQEKRTQAWDTPLNSANAIYAFLAYPDPPKGREQEVSSAAVGATVSELSAEASASVKLYIGNEEIALPQGTAGIGYVKKDISKELNASTSNAQRSTFNVQRSSSSVGWGAFYAQFFQPASDIQNLSRGLTVKREVIYEDGTPVEQTPNLNPQPSNLKVGDRVRVRITITADRDYDFVQVIDKRAACLEPVNQLSGYHGGFSFSGYTGYYITPRDFTTNYYFDRMAKGTHVVETEYYIDRAGEYTSGTCTAQCAYAPEFMGRDSSFSLFPQVGR